MTVLFKQYILNNMKNLEQFMNLIQGMLQLQHESNVIFEWVASLLCILEILVIPTYYFCDFQKSLPTNANRVSQLRLCPP
jgi:hypothetical protein